MKRRNAREYALQFLFRIDFSAGTPDQAQRGSLEDDLSLFWEISGEKDPHVRQYAESLIKGTLQHIASIDAILQSVAERWNLLRMASVDLTILRFASYELLYRPDIPPAVTINEAIEIAKKFSTADSASFINGILDKISKDRSGERDAPIPAAGVDS